MRKVWERMVPLSKIGRDWDIDFWQAQTPGIRFSVTWRMVADFYQVKGRKIDGNILRLQRTVETFKRAYYRGKKKK